MFSTARLAEPDKAPSQTEGRTASAPSAVHPSRPAPRELAGPAPEGRGTATGHRESFYRETGKRIFDLGLISLFALPTLIVTCLVALLVWTDGANPFYRQERIGRGGRVFRIWKLRSMVVDADARLEAHLAAHPAARAEWNTKQKLRNDPRVTPIGRFIRKTSLDELPQLWNVIRGDMSRVGPRPMMLDQRALYPGDAYFEMRPGVTGYWQTSARNDTSFADRARFDTAYHADMSLGTDLGVLLRSVNVVLKGTGC